MAFVLDRIFEGACRPFKIRVEQVLQSQPSLIISYKLSNTLEFYSHTISDLLGKDAALCNTLWLLKDAAQQTFFNILRSRGEKLLRYPPLVAVDLSPPPAVREVVSLLLELIDTYKSMMIPASDKKTDFDPVVTALLDPLVQMCEKAAEAHKSKGAVSRRSRTSSDLGSSSRDSLTVDAMLSKKTSNLTQDTEMSTKIYLINCLSAIQLPLVGQEVAGNYLNKLTSAIDTNISNLVRKEVDAILMRCGLLSKLSYIQKSISGDDGSEPGPLAEAEEMSPVVLSECLRTFFELATGNEGLLPEFEQLQLPSLRSDARIRVARALADGYELLYQAVVDPKNNYPDPRSLMRHSPDQIRTILEI
ncbi:conserved oligomeric Golgi complex subunit 6 [Canna indica]|uniref:Conserved oligomeric Golgi complex subunit 6 n=1 Tax=Canna indica TaxID=4628 RepID=A0AAQ3K2I5_9LILI|nr:conserved oligomeric Golgi complex subunit 6 [Canna indica]